MSRKFLFFAILRQIGDVPFLLDLGDEMKLRLDVGSTSRDYIFSMRMSALLLAVIFVCNTGCTTTRSTPLSRDGNNKLQKDLQPSPKGIPITIKVPTHLDVTIHETYYLENVATSDDAGKQKFADLREVKTTNRNLWVEVTPIETEKVFTVDWKRPLSGTLDYSAELGEDQYFDKLGATTNDSSITDVTGLIGQITQTVIATAAPVGNDTNLLTDDRVVAHAKFDIDDCDFEEQVLAFVSHHLNNCNDCQGQR